VSTKSIEKIVASVIKNHRVTRVQLKQTAHQGPKIRAAKNECMLAMYRTGCTYTEIGAELGIGERSVSARLSILRDEGHEVIMRSTKQFKKLPVLNGPSMVDKAGDRRDDCTRNSECLKALVKYHPDASNGSCPVGCGYFQGIPKDRVRSEAMRGECAWATV
jgi:biotin operon repressor